MFLCREFNGSDIDLNASYSDDDDTIPLDEKKFWEYLQKLEENNLFEMNLLQDSQQTLEKMEKEAADTVAAKRSKVEELDTNIHLLEDMFGQKQDRLAYYRNMLDHKDKSDAASKAGNSKGSKSKAQNTVVQLDEATI